VKHNGVACVILVRRDCANQVWPAVGGKPCDKKYVAKICPPEKDKEIPCPARNSDPGGKYTPHHPGTATYYNPPATKSKVAPDYKRGSAEKVEEDRGTGAGSSGSEGNNGKETECDPVEVPEVADDPPVEGDLPEVN